MSRFQELSNTPDLMSVLRATQNDLSNKLNCIKVGIVEEFYEDRTAKIQIAGKWHVGTNKDGSQILKDYPPIFAKVLYMGWGNIQITYPLQKGTEGILLFCDDEIESWYINGGVNQPAYNRKHSVTDAIFLAGLSSAPNTETIANLLKIQNKNAIITLEGATINLNGNVNVSTGASGTFTTKDNKTVTVVNGIITQVV